MRIPKFLEASGTIGFVAPAFGCNMEPYRSGFDAAQKTFAALGHTMILGPNCYEGSGIGISNTPPKCGEEINTFFAKQEGYFYLLDVHLVNYQWQPSHHKQPE